mgnify:CR=1 FL=1
MIASEKKAQWSCDRLYLSNYSYSSVQYPQYVFVYFQSLIFLIGSPCLNFLPRAYPLLGCRVYFYPR